MLHCSAGILDSTSVWTFATRGFRRRSNEHILSEINEMIIDYNTPDDPTPGGGSKTDETESDADENAGALILDARCASQRRFVQQSRNSCSTSGVSKISWWIPQKGMWADTETSRTSDCHRSGLWTVEVYVSQPGVFRSKQNCEHRQCQPCIRLIVRGRAVTLVEFAAKLDLSLNEKEMARIEKWHLMHIQRKWCPDFGSTALLRESRSLFGTCSDG